MASLIDHRQMRQSSCFCKRSTASIRIGRGLVWSLALVVAGIVGGKHLAAQVNTPPRLAANQPIWVKPGAKVTITSDLLRTVDDETLDPEEIVYRVMPGETNAPVGIGSLILGNRALVGNQEFSQADINNKVLFYQAPATVDQPGVGIPFNVRDFDGVLAHDGPFSTFSLRITFSNTPPVALDGSFVCPLGNKTTGVMTSTNAETYQTVTYSIVTPPSKGVLSNVNTNAGTFTYTANIGESGEDTFQFRAYDGVNKSVDPGVITIVIANTTPKVTPAMFVVNEDDEIEGRVRATDPDRPNQKLTFELVTPPLRGTLESWDPATGVFFYRPDAGRFGYDYFMIAVTDGIDESAYQRIELNIRPYLDDGLIFVSATESLGDPTSSADDLGGVYALNPANGDTFRMVTADFLRENLAMVYDPRREELIVSGTVNKTAFVAAIEVNSGEVRPIAFGDPLVFPIGLAFDKNGQLFVANGDGGNILRINTVTGATSVVATGNLLVTPTAVKEDPDGMLTVLDAVDLFGDASRIIRINPATGVQTAIFGNNLLLDPADFLELSTNRVLIVGRGGLFEWLRAEGTLKLLVPPEKFEGLPKEIEMDQDGRILIVEIFGRILRYNLATQDLTVVQSELGLSPAGIAAVQVSVDYNDWKQLHFLPQDLADPSKESTLWGDQADPDKDGLPNRAEFALGRNPARSDAAGVFNFTKGTNAGKEYILFPLTMRRDVDSSRYVIEMSSDLVHWDAQNLEVDDTDSLGRYAIRRTYRYPILKNAPVVPRFFRLNFVP